MPNRLAYARSYNLNARSRSVGRATPNPEDALISNFISSQQSWRNAGPYRTATLALVQVDKWNEARDNPASIGVSLGLLCWSAYSEISTPQDSNRDSRRPNTDERMDS